MNVLSGHVHFRWTLVTLPIPPQIVTVNEQTRSANFITLEFSIRYAMRQSYAPVVYFDVKHFNFSAV